jgi:hypothetical protein
MSLLNMQGFAFSTIIGLGFEMLGAFFLAVEAMGLDTIELWNTNVFAVVTYRYQSLQGVETQRRAAHGDFRWLPYVVFVIATGCGALLGAWLVHTIKAINPPWKPQWTSVGGIIIGAIVGPFTLWGIMNMFKAGAHFFKWIEHTTQKGTIGLIGFVLIFVGLLLQIVGTVPHLFN